METQDFTTVILTKWQYAGVKKMINFFIGLIIMTCLLAIGYCIGATEHINIFSDVKWTDIGTLLVTFFGFSFGFISYFQWLSSKRKEDAYMAAKKYLASIDEIEEHLHELLLQYNHLCPTPGGLVENKDISLKRIEHLNNVCNYLYQARRALYKSHRELAFWNVRLTANFNEDHKSMNQSLDRISIVGSTLNNQLFHFIEHNKENINYITNQKKLFDDIYNEIYKVTQKRVECGFKAMFLFEQ